jgi:hypothetical protein
MQSYDWIEHIGNVEHKGKCWLTKFPGMGDLCEKVLMSRYLKKIQEIILGISYATGGRGGSSGGGGSSGAKAKAVIAETAHSRVESTVSKVDSGLSKVSSVGSRTTKKTSDPGEDGDCSFSKTLERQKARAGRKSLFESHQPDNKPVESEHQRNVRKMSSGGNNSVHNANSVSSASSSYKKQISTQSQETGNRTPGRISPMPTNSSDDDDKASIYSLSALERTTISNPKLNPNHNVNTPSTLENRIRELNELAPINDGENNDKSEAEDDDEECELPALFEAIPETFIIPDELPELEKWFKNKRGQTRKRTVNLNEIKKRRDPKLRLRWLY